jgi:hypothetical protein
MATKGGTRKHDRNRKSAQNLRYINERRHEKSHTRRVRKHLEIFPADEAAHVALKRWIAQQ